MKSKSIIFFVIIFIFCSCKEKKDFHTIYLWKEKQNLFNYNDWHLKGIILNGKIYFYHSSGKEANFKTFAIPLKGEGKLIVRYNDFEKLFIFKTPMSICFKIKNEGSINLESDSEILLSNPRISEPFKIGKKVLFIIADALRYDYVNKYNMPSLLKYFKNGYFFRNAYSPESWTLPSLASIFTGKIPSHLRTENGTLISIPPDEKTISEYMREKGYFTIGISANYTVNHENGFSKGFMIFCAPNAKSKIDKPDAKWINDLAINFIKSFEDEDIFLYLHYMEPHEPYRNHENKKVYYSFNYGEVISKEKIEEVKNSYSSEIKYLDLKLNELLNKISNIKLVVFTADHGEEFGENGSFKHGPTLYDEVVHVPLIIMKNGEKDGNIINNFSTLNLINFILSENIEYFKKINIATVETFSHGPPRFRIISNSGSLFFLSKELLENKSIDETYLLIYKKIPSYFFIDNKGNYLRKIPEELYKISVYKLIEQFKNFKSGIFLFVSDSNKHFFDVQGEISSILVWGAYENIEILKKENKIKILSHKNYPFNLFFISGKCNTIRITENNKDILLSPNPPKDLGVSIYAFKVTGKSKNYINGIEETLKRLKALGYIK